MKACTEKQDSILLFAFCGGKFGLSAGLHRRTWAGVVEVCYLSIFDHVVMVANIKAVYFVHRHRPVNVHPAPVSMKRLG